MMSPIDSDPAEVASFGAQEKPQSKMEKVAQNHLKKRAKQETDEWLVNGAASDSVRRIVQERNVLRTSHDDTATE